MFEMKKMSDYGDLKTDVLSITDVSGRFIGVCLEYYGLNPGCYFNSPTWVNWGCNAEDNWCGARVYFRH